MKDDLNPKRNLAFLNKSLFVRGRKCAKSFYLSKHFSELKDVRDSNRETRFNQGREVGDLARQLFQGGVLVPLDGLTLHAQVEMTGMLMASEAHVYDAAFLVDDTFVKCDILSKQGASWDLYDVRAATKAKDAYVLDAALQYHIARKAGVDVRRVFLTLINKSYVRGETLDVQELFRQVDITDKCVELEAEVEETLKYLKQVAHEEMPRCTIGRHCYEPYPCDYHSYCWKDLPDKNIFDVKGDGFPKYELLQQGIVSLEDIPTEALSGRVRMQVQATLNEKNFVDQPRLQAFLNRIEYPVVHVDFETFQSAVPPFPGMKPFQQVPFQFSAHHQMEVGAEPRHEEYLAEQDIDPRREFLVRLLDVARGAKTVLVYNRSFEANVVRSLGELFKDLKPLAVDLAGRMVDLMDPLSKRWVYCWEFHGGYSIKTVLPVLAPGFNYDGLDVANGQEAAEAYHAARTSEQPEFVGKIRKWLLEYCSLDTLAMVKILNSLYDIAENPSQFNKTS